MTKKDYILIAETIREARFHQKDERGRGAIEVVAHRIAESLKKENTRFEMSRFLEACGIEWYSVPCVKCGGLRDCEALKCNKC